MKVESYSYPRSAFLSTEKDTGILVDLFMRNERLKKLLFYSSKDALSRPNLTQKQSFGLLGKQIKIIPKLKVDQPEFCYIIIQFDNFTPNATNPAFRDNILFIDIICHFDQWQLQDFQLRPYRIAAEIDSMINNRKLSGIGKVDFLNSSQIVLNDEFAGLALGYSVIHGYEGEDSKFAMNPAVQLDIDNNWDQMFNEPNEL